MVKITTLAENLAYGKGLQGEHGRSLFVEANGHHILFDTGASDLFIRNARLMSIDLSTVDYVVLSHGHRDHTGGLNQFLAINKKAVVVCKAEIFQRKFKNDKENGILHPNVFDKSRFRFIDQTTELVPGVFVCPNLPIIDPLETHFDQFFVEANGARRPDDFQDELALVLKENDELTLLSACSHRGITNIMRAVQKEFPDNFIQMIIGGFHIHTAEEAKYRAISTFLEQHLPNRIGACHCTGVGQYARFQQDFGPGVFYNYTGWVEEICSV